MTTRLHDLGNISAARIVHIDHSRTIIGQNLIKKPCFCSEISVKTLVIIQMILGEIGKSRCAQLHAIKTRLVKPVA